jgi:hypothetical protein
MRRTTKSRSWGLRRRAGYMLSRTVVRVGTTTPQGEEVVGTILLVTRMPRLACAVSVQDRKSMVGGRRIGHN